MNDASALLDDPPAKVAATGGVGISLSGGGLRAASFSLGALQALDEKHGLLRGDTSADYVAAVSGGSYIASTLALVNAGSAAKTCDGTPLGAAVFAGARPLAQGSPEVQHILRHCRYLVEDGGWVTATRILLTMIGNVVILLAMFAFAAYYLVIVALFAVDRFPFGYRLWTIWEKWVANVPKQLTGEDIAVLSVVPGAFATLVETVVFCLGVVLIARAFAAVREVSRLNASLDEDLRRDGAIQDEIKAARKARAGQTRFRRGWAWSRILFGLFACFITSIDVLLFIHAVPFLSSPSWLVENAAVVITVAAIVVGVILTLFLLSLIRPLAPMRTAARVMTGIIAQLFPLMVLLLTFTWTASYLLVTAFPYLGDDPERESSELDYLILVALGAAPFAIAMILRFFPSAHDLYRRLVARCFAVIRVHDGAQAVDVTNSDIAMSSLIPASAKVPELLICAAANVSDPGSAPAGARALPLVMSPRVVEIPTVSRASLPTTAFEKDGSQAVGGQTGRALPLGLTAAVATTGAAISPAMGRFTSSQLRPLLATLGVRLGRWIPNPASALTREAVAENRLPSARQDAMVVLRELFGSHDSKSHSVYATDGGHFENMGLVALLRRRCGEIWLVDASPHTFGYPLSLTQSLLAAEAETGCRFDIPMDALGKTNKKGNLDSVKAVGDVRYADGTHGQIRIVKLGITDGHSSIVKNYARIDPGFPFHATIQQIYTAERFEAYRRLGWESTQQLFELQVTDAST